MNDIDLTKILKNCPKGTKLYTTVWGEVTFNRIDNEKQLYPIYIEVDADYITSLTKKGYYANKIDADCILFPSKEQRDWSKFTAPWYKKDKFDPKTLKAFDKVLVFDSDRPWTPLLFSYLEYSLNYPRMQCFDFIARKVIPYNEETEHLIATYNEAPEFYRYWED